MQVKARDPVDHRLACDVKRRVRPRGRHQGGELGRAPFGQQNRDRLEPLAGDQVAQHHFALGDEQALAPDKVPLLDIAIAGDAAIVRIVDADQARSR